MIVYELVDSADGVLLQAQLPFTVYEKTVHHESEASRLGEGRLMAKTSKQGTTDKWGDSLGQEFRPGDLVAIAVINDKSPQMVIARVERINTTNPKGEPHMRSVKTGQKVPKEYPRREYVGPALENPRGPEVRTMQDRRAAQERDHAKQRDKANWRHWTETRMVDEWHDVPNVTVTATPILDGRGFRRSDPSRKWTWDPKEQVGRYVKVEGAPKARPVTYTLIGNIVKLPGHVTEESIEKLSTKREVEY